MTFLISRGSTAGKSLSNERLSTANLIRSIRQLCQAAIDAQQVNFEMKLETSSYHLQGDAGRLQQVLWNLLSNAIKFTPPGGVIESRTSVVVATEFQIQLSDSRRGIGSDALESIFQPFERGDLSVTSIDDLGLGLADCQIHRGCAPKTNSAESSASATGAIFTVSLPLAEPEQI